MLVLQWAALAQLYPTPNVALLNVGRDWIRNISNFEDWRCDGIADLSTKLQGFGVPWKLQCLFTVWFIMQVEKGSKVHCTSPESTSKDFCLFPTRYIKEKQPVVLPSTCSCPAVTFVRVHRIQHINSPKLILPPPMQQYFSACEMMMYVLCIVYHELCSEIMPNVLYLAGDLWHCGSVLCLEWAAPCRSS